MLRIENPKVIKAIIDCLNLPINRKCDVALADRSEITFILDEYETPQQSVTFPISHNIEIRWWGAEFTIMHRGDIGHWTIDTKTGIGKWCCCYNRQGRIKYGRYYEPNYD